MPVSLLRAALLLLFLSGCRTASNHSPPLDPEVAGLLQQLRAAPDDGLATYELAARYAALGENEQALRWMERLEALRWSYGVGDAHFGALARAPEYREVAARLAALHPRVARSRPAFTLAEKALTPEGITYDPVTDTFFVSSIRKRKVVSLARNGQLRDFTGSGQDGLLGVLGMKVDAERRHLWVASYASRGMENAKPEERGHSGLFQYDLRTGGLLRRFALGNQPRANLVNDIALDASGDVFVTNSERGTVSVLRAGTEALVPLMPEGTLPYPNGIALSEDGARLYVAHSQGIASVEPSTGRHTPVRAPPGVLLAGLDGMSIYRGSLIGVQNGFGRGRIVRFHFGADPTRVEREEPLESGNPLFDIPTTGTVVGNTFVYIANSQLRRRGPEGELLPPEQLDETVLLQVALDE
ncbi:SMP-30/gluconolactonase/LRE family protein [Archangium violaceum]|uniref:SMP-30/gluconolactonase/LRE family protein n=1 Tax=Archangium violaceum TaxID=83451 RepID=UPI002B3024D7|nr:SMP-30/gluconolactonase/LRE family protein [Archangium gephyra]